MSAVRVKVGPTPAGVYNSAKAYEKLDLVYDGATNATYIARGDVPEGTELTNTDYWQVYVTNVGPIFVDESSGVPYRIGITGGRLFIEPV